MSELRSVKKVCVIGAGTMGSGIAAHLANLGFQVTLLDVTPQSVTEAFEKAKAAKPPLFVNPDRAMDVRLGNTSDNLNWVSEADWVVEAVFERQGVKRSIYNRIQDLVQPDAFISTNTSGLEIELLAEGLSESFQRRFIGTHFFNPPRYLKLLELIPTTKTDPEIVAAMSDFLEDRVARRIIVAKDTPGFIANRYGMWCMYHAVHVAEKLRLTIEQVDAITGVFLGRPKSASFRLNDIVGLDVMNDIATNLLERCPNDPFIQTYRSTKSIAALLERKWIGEKTRQGYYRKEGKELLVLDLGTLAYRQMAEVDLPSLKELAPLPLNERISRALELKDETGEFLRHYLPPALKYADYLKEEISHSVIDIDRVMEWGFGWQQGPFATIDALGPVKSGVTTGPFYEGESVRSHNGNFVHIPSNPKYKPLQEYQEVGNGETYRLRDLGDGVTAVCLTTKMGTISPTFVKELTDLIESDRLDRFVLTGDSRTYSAGFDLRFFAQAIIDERWIEIDHELLRLQKLGEMLEASKVVTAVYGHALGAGLELALSTSKIVAQLESKIGLPEAKVGLFPGGRGTTLMRLYNQHTAKRLSEVAFNLATGTIANNSEEARQLGYLRPTDQTEFHPDRLIYTAKLAALEVKPVTRPEISTATGPLSGMIDRLLEVARAKGDMSKHDELVGQKIKIIMSKATSYEDCLTKERTEFLDLCTKALTTARIQHMLANGTALRN